MLISALIMGIIGNLHCLGMCGPIALMIPVKKNNKLGRLISILLYNFGRLFTYSFLGALFGSFGHGIKLAGFQQQLSIVIGSILIIAIMFPKFIRIINHGNSFINKSYIKFKNKFSYQLKKKTYSSIFAIGLLNGLLPCGLIYLALTGAIITGSWYSGILYMFYFGIGTLPIMILLPYFNQIIAGKFKKKMSRILPYAMILFGVLMILRGSNLGIPYISPKINTVNISCCQVK
jgi:uncharacterized protein